MITYEQFKNFQQQQRYAALINQDGTRLSLADLQEEIVIEIPKGEPMTPQNSRCYFFKEQTAEQRDAIIENILRHFYNKFPTEFQKIVPEGFAEPKATC